MTLFSLAVTVSIGGILIELSRSALEGVGRIDPSIDIVIGPKSSGLEIILDGLHFIGQSLDLISYDSINSIVIEVRPRHLIPITYFADLQGTPVVGTDQRFYSRHPSMPPPRVVEGEWFKGLREVVLGAKAAERLKLRPGDLCLIPSVPLEPGADPVWIKEFKVVGILNPMNHSGDWVAYVSIQNAWEFHKIAYARGLMHPLKKGNGVSYLLLTLDPYRKKEQQQALYDLVHNRGGEQLIDVNQELLFLQRFLGQGRIAVSVVAFFLVTLSASIACLLFTERFETLKLDLAILRAFGYSRWTIGRMILWEGFLLTGGGIFIGIGLQLFGTEMIPRFWNPTWLAELSWNNPWVLTLWGGTFTVALLSTLLPLLRLYRWNAHDALKGL